VLLVIVIYVPLSLAFANQSGEQVWQYVIDITIIILLFIDLVLNFFTAYYDDVEITIVDDRKVNRFLSA
jgi:fumarate reductase subunit D